MPLIPIKELAQEAADAVSDLLSDANYDAFASLSDVEQVQWRYSYADCDDFALAINKITGWPIVGINDMKMGPIHRLVLASDGRFVDVMGFVSLDDIKKRYRLKHPSVDQEARFHSPTIEKSEDFLPVISAILQLPVQPFNTPGFLAKTAAFANEFEVVIDVNIKENNHSATKLKMTL